MWGGGALGVLELEDTNFCESPSLSTKPLAWASVASKLEVPGFAVLSQENCSATPRGLSGNCHADCVVEGRGKPGIPGVAGVSPVRTSPA